SRRRGNIRIILTIAVSGGTRPRWQPQRARSPHMQQCGDTPTDENSLAGDILRGVPAIARFIGEDKRAAYHLCWRGYIPGGKEGNTWSAAKTRLREHYASLTRGATPE